MLDTLSDMEVANTIMSSNDKAKDATSVNLLDKRFKDLKLKEMTVLDHKSAEYKGLQQYLLDSSSGGHGLKYRLQDIFRIERPGEATRFKKHTSKLKDSNRLLLWHGSRTTNYGGILSQGLRIAPPGKCNKLCVDPYVAIVLRETFVNSNLYILLMNNADGVTIRGPCQWLCVRKRCVPRGLQQQISQLLHCGYVWRRRTSSARRG